MSQREADRRAKKKEASYRRWVSAKFLSGYYEVTPKTIWAWAKSGRLPPPEKIGPNCTRWDFEKIQELEAA